MPISKDTSRMYYDKLQELTLKFSESEAYEILAVQSCISADSIKRYVRYHKARLAQYAMELEEGEDIKSISPEAGARKLVKDAMKPKTIFEKVVNYNYPDGNGNFYNREDVFPILAIPDLHIPFEHLNALQFCKDVMEEYKCKTVIQMGDETDGHAISRHQSSQDADGAKTEYEISKERIAEWFKAFPNAYHCVGNHSAIPTRRAAELGIPRAYIKGFHELWGAPDTWITGVSHVIGGVLFKHGTGCAGKLGEYNAAIKNRMSTVIGHLHSSAGVKYHANPDSLIFGLNCGCLIDADAYAFEYGKEFPDKATLGCGIIFSPTHATFIPMTDKYFRGE